MSEVKKIKRGDFWMLDADEAWDHVNALQTELDRLERVGSERKEMTVEGIENYLEKAPPGTVTSRKSLAEYIQPLTVQQGFVPDWSKAPEWATEVNILWHGGMTGQVIESIPLPAPKTRERTHQEKVHELMKKLTIDPVFQSVNKELVDDLCRAAGVDLTVTEE